MRITDVVIHPVASERHYVATVVRPGYRPAKGRSKYWIYEFATDAGITGIGETSDLNRDLDPEATAAAIRAVVVGRSPFDTEWILDALDVPRPVVTAVDIACRDLQGKATGRPACDLLGGRILQRVKASWVIYIREADGLEEELAPKLGLGIRAFKMKVGADLTLDLERVAEVRRLAGADAEIKVDANGAWTVPEAIDAIGRLSEFGIAGVETPIKPVDVDDMVTVKRAVGVPVIEHGSNTPRHLEMIQKGAVDAFKISVAAGGLRRAKEIAAMARIGGIAAYVGSTVEMGPGTAAALHFAVSTPGTDGYAADLRGPLLLTDDVLATPIRYEDGYLNLPEGPGLGVELDRHRLEALRYDPAAEREETTT